MNYLDQGSDQWINTIIQVHYKLLAQSNTAIATGTTERAKRVLTDITTGKIAQAILILSLTYAAFWATDRLINIMAERVPIQFRLSVKQSLPFCRAIILIVTTVSILNLFLNLSPSNVLAVTGTVAVATGFAFKDYASSVIAGLIALFETPYQVGDRITLNGYYGEVTGYGLRGIRLQTPDNCVVTIPHNKIWTEAISNANKGKLEVQVITEFYLAHSTNIQQVIKILYRVAYTSKYTQLYLPISVVAEEKLWGIYFKLKSYPRDMRDEAVYKTDLIKRAKQAFNAHHLSYPQEGLDELRSQWK